MVEEILNLLTQVPVRSVAVVLFVTWAVKHALNLLKSGVYTNWLMPLVALAVGVVVEKSVGNTFGDGIIAGGAAIVSFSVFSNMIEGLGGFADPRGRGKKLKKLASESADESRKMVEKMGTPFR
jgi:hypothetical protein